MRPMQVHVEGPVLPSESPSHHMDSKMRIQPQAMCRVVTSCPDGWQAVSAPGSTGAACLRDKGVLLNPGLEIEKNPCH